MARFRDKEKALILRREGKSYSQIKKLLGVSKGTLSAWLRDYPLSRERIRELRDCNEQRIERYRITRRTNREKVLRGIYEEEKTIISPLLKDPGFLSGLFLYWGEGCKTKPNELIITNTNPSIIRAGISWMKSLGIGQDRLRVKLHLYRDMDIDQEILFWSQITSIPRNRFHKTYVKESSLAGLSYKRGFGHGTCNIILADGKVAKRIHMDLRVLNEYFLGQ
jgi:predicted transcriptional regulator